MKPISCDHMIKNLCFLETREVSKGLRTIQGGEAKAGAKRAGIENPSEDINKNLLNQKCSNTDFKPKCVCEKHDFSQIQMKYNLAFTTVSA